MSSSVSFGSTPVSLDILSQVPWGNPYCRRCLNNYSVSAGEA
ncbi:MAG: hypothetical protein ABGY72_05650 [bacterium]